MATVNAVIYKTPSKDGTFPIAIRITINRKHSYLFTGQSISSLDQWDEKNRRVKKSHPNSSRLNNFLLAKLAEANDKALEMETGKASVSAKAVKTGLRPVEIKAVTFQEIANNYLNEQKGLGNYDVFSADASRLKRFYEFAGTYITFPEITVELLRRYTLFLRMSKNRNRKTMPEKLLSERTVTNHLLILRTLYNRAVTAKAIAKDERYPFGQKDKISIKFGKSEKIGLSPEEINQLKNYQFSKHQTHLHHSRNIWLVCFYFAGMRVTDALLLKWSDFQNGRFYYTMSKNGEPGSLPVPSAVTDIIEGYKEDNRKHDLVFWHLKDLDNLEDRYELRRRISSVTKMIGEHMANIMTVLAVNKNASPHKARHAFAQRAEEKEIHPKVLQKMYRHESILTTMNYQSNFSHAKADAALEAVIDF